MELLLSAENEWKQSHVNMIEIYGNQSGDVEWKWHANISKAGRRRLLYHSGYCFVIIFSFVYVCIHIHLWCILEYKVIISHLPYFLPQLTHWGRATHICVGKLTIIGPDNGLSPRRRQAIIWTNAGILLIGPLGTNFSKILIGIQTFSFKKMHLKMSSAKYRPFVSASMY